MANYEKTFVVRISVDKNHLGSGFTYAHEGDWLSNSESEEDYYITPTDDELTKSIQNEILSWLGDLRFDVQVDSTEYKYLRNGLTVALDLLSDEQLQEWDKDMGYESEEE